jgi:hypothetical protein
MTVGGVPHAPERRCHRVVIRRVVDDDAVSNFAPL